MYPLTDLAPMREVTYLTHKTPLKGTEFEKILGQVYTPDETSQKICVAGPVQQVSANFDSIM